MWARRVRFRLSSAKGYPRLGLPTQGFNWPSGCTFFIPRSIKGCLRLGLPTQGFNRPSRHAFMFKGTCQQVMVIITYRSTALSESDFSICNAIGVKTGMQKMKTSFNHNFTTNTTRHCFEADSLSPVESPVCRSEAGFSRYAYVCSATTALLGSRPVESTDSPRRNYPENNGVATRYETPGIY